MKHTSPVKHLGNTQWERDQIDMCRRERNCAIVFFAIVVLGSLFLGWSA